jgi:hypothetical protein
MAEETEKKPDNKKGAISKRTWLIGGIVAGIAIYIWWKRKQAAAANSTVGGIPISGMPGGAGNATTSPAPNQFTSLQAWMAAVQTWAVTLGYDPAVTQNALQAYSQGQCVTASGFTIIDKALGFFGQPPGAPYQGLVQCGNQPGGGSGGGGNLIDQFFYHNQLQELQNTGTSLLHQWTDVSGKWFSEYLPLPNGVAPASGASPVVTVGGFGDPNRIDYSILAANGGTIHGWYTPANGWYAELIGGNPSQTQMGGQSRIH